MIEIRSSVDCLTPFGACAQIERLAADATAAAVSRNSRRFMLFLLRQRVSNCAGRRRPALRLDSGTRSSATTAATTPLVRHNHEILAAFGFIADRYAAGRSVEGAGPQHLTCVLIVGAHFAIVAGVKYHAALGDD